MEAQWLGSLGKIHFYGKSKIERPLSCIYYYISLRTCTLIYTGQCYSTQPASVHLKFSQQLCAINFLDRCEWVDKLVMFSERTICQSIRDYSLFCIYQKEKISLARTNFCQYPPFLTGKRVNRVNSTQLRRDLKPS